jgi:hypothetical protein
VTITSVRILRQRKVKDIEEKKGEHLDDSNFILQDEDGIDLKMLRILMKTALVQW